MISIIWITIVMIIMRKKENGRGEGCHLRGIL